MSLLRMGSMPLLCLIVGSVVTHAADRPNVLIVITDEHNFRTLGCYRNVLPKEQAEMWGPGTIVETPHLDRLANEGVICTRAYATAPVCSPSRSAMVTGLYPQNTGVPTNDEKLRTDIPTLATILGSQGYRTSFVGKWHLGGASKPGWAPEIDGGFRTQKIHVQSRTLEKTRSCRQRAVGGCQESTGSPIL